MQGLLGEFKGGKRADESNPQPFGLVRGYFTQPLFDVAVPASRRRGNVEVLLAQQRLNVAVVEQLHATRIAFYAALFNDSLRELGEAQRQRLSENISTQVERYQAGQTDRGAMLNARLLERELEPRIEEVRRGYQECPAYPCDIYGQLISHRRQTSSGRRESWSSAALEHDLQF